MPRYQYQDRPEYRKAMRLLSFYRWQDEDFRRDMSKLNHDVAMRPEQRQQRKERAIALWQQPAYREKQAIAQQERRRTKSAEEIFLRKI